jgi:hypothetical protein
MLKLSQILLEDKNVHISRFIKKSLYYMCQEKVSPLQPDKVYDFLENKLYLKDEKEIMTITKLYCYNFMEKDIVSGKCEPKVNLGLPIENYSSEQLALSQYLALDPYFVELYKEGTVTDLAEYQNTLENTTYLIGTYEESINATKQKIKNIIYGGEGYEYWDDDYLSYYIEVDYDTASYNAENYAIDSQGNYDEDEMRVDLYVDDEYVDLIEEKELEEEELKYRITKYKTTKFKLEKLEKEKKIIEREIETLGFSLDYDDDSYSEMYNIDISEMTDALHELETTIYEYLTYNEYVENEIFKLEEIIEQLKHTIEDYEGEELANKWIEHKTEMTLQDFMDNPIDYIESSGFTVNEAEEEGMIYVDADAIINDNSREMGTFLGDFGIESHNIKFEGVRYWIFRDN